MKTEYWIIAIVLLLLTSLGGVMEMNTIICDQQTDLVEMDKLRAETYWTRIAAMPKPHSPPLEQAWISSGTGYRMDPMGGGTEGLHKGLDLAGPVGTPVNAVLAGVVAEHWLVPGWHYGKYYHGDPILGGKIVLDHGGGLFSIYGHLSKTEVHEGQYIKMGQKIGELGNTGISTGPHLHLEIVVDPLRYLDEQ
jgi:murein DD-endopeptidase MepM/ murein hydrolase activator NlpD